MSSDSLLEQARAAVTRAQRVAVLTGAGVSAEAGIPTFRSAGGLWRGFRPEELATPEGFARDPAMVWEWYDWRRSLIAEASPNPGHYALAEFERRREPGTFTLITQNVDGLHERAGSANVLRLHGSIWELRCLGCGRVTEDLRARLPVLPPVCSECGGMLRPGVVWFGESLPEQVFARAGLAARRSDVLIVAGTSAVVYPAAMLAPVALESGAAVIEVNTEETAVSGLVTFALRGTSGEVLPALLG